MRTTVTWSAILMRTSEMLLEPDTPPGTDASRRPPGQAGDDHDQEGRTQQPGSVLLAIHLRLVPPERGRSHLTCPTLRRQQVPRSEEESAASGGDRRRSRCATSR